MILEFKVKNYKSFRDKEVFTMIPDTKNRRHTDHIITKGTDDTKYHEALATAIIYGKNASGKSNLVKGLAALSYMISDIEAIKVDKKIQPYEPYKLNQNSPNEPVELELDFIAGNNLRYIYSIAYSAKEIVHERLQFYPKSQIALLYERNGMEFKYGNYFKGNKQAIEDNLYKNQLFLSKVATHKVDSLIEVYQYFKNQLNIFSSIPSIVDMRQYNAAVRELSGQSEQSQNRKTRLIELLKGSDTDIQNIKVTKRNMEDFEFPDTFPEEIKSEIYKSNMYDLKLSHLAEEGKTIDFTIDEESQGTRRLIGEGYHLLAALEEGKVYVADEFERHLHSNLAHALIKLFQSRTTNPKGAQLIIVTHDIKLLNADLFRRDEVWFVEKKQGCSSSLSPLSEYAGVREDTPFGRWYESGKFGAVPNIDSEIGIKQD